MRRLRLSLLTFAWWAAFGLILPAYGAPQHGIVPFGELKYPRAFTHFDYVNPDAPKGGKLRLSSPQAFDSLNPFITKGVSAPLMQELVFEPLMQRSLDEPQAYYGLIAESIELAPDRAYADFVLRREARWHDGSPIRADDVLYSYEALTTLAHPAYQNLYEPITRVEALSERKVRFHFADPKNRQLPLLAASMSILPKHYYETVAFDQTTLEPPLGSGPYRVKSVDAGRKITFERVEDYWGKNLPVNRGSYNFDTVQLRVFRNETVALEAFLASRYDFRTEYIARNWATAYDVPARASGELVQAKIPHKLPSGMQGFLFNLRKPALADSRVRRAIALAMDYEWMNDTLFYGAYERSHSFFQNTNFMATELPTEAELALMEPQRAFLPEAAFDTIFRNPESDGAGFPRAQLIQAQALLNEAGWQMAEDGLRYHPDHTGPLSVEFLMRQPTFGRVIQSIIRNLDKLGIRGSTRYVGDAQYQQQLQDRDFDIISIWWNRGLFFPGPEQKSYWHSSQADIPASQNYSGLKNPGIDALLEAISQADSLDELTVAARAFDRSLLHQHVVIPHWHMPAWRILYWNRFGRPEQPPSYDIGLWSWWHREEAE